MNNLRARLNEKSTQAGIAVVASMLAYFVGPQAMTEAAPLVAAAAGFYEIIRREK